jgi:hypothetical protein
MLFSANDPIDRNVRGGSLYGFGKGVIKHLRQTKKAPNETATSFGKRRRKRQ